MTGQPPKLSDSTKAVISGAAESDPTGSHVGGTDAASKTGGQKVKSEKECTTKPQCDGKFLWHRRF